MTQTSAPEAGQTIAYRKHGRGRRVGMLVQHAEQVSETTTYVIGQRVRLADNALCSGKISVLIHAGDTFEVIAR